MKKLFVSAFAAAVACALMSTSACSSSSGGHTHDGDAGHVSKYPSCQAIIDKCHELDVGDPGAIHDCHELAHDAPDDATCAAKKDECTKACVAPADGGSDAADASGG